MIFTYVIVLLTIICIHLTASEYAVEDAITQRHKYGVARYEVVTDDGYVLELNHLIEKKSLIPKSKMPVLIMHGLCMGSPDYLLQDDEFGLPYLLKRAGFDVWLGNNRGNPRLRKHTKIDPYTDSKEYWNYSFHEIGLYDIPALTDFILEATERSQILYIGHSQGGASFLSMCATRPVYNAKVAAAALMAPATYWKRHVNFILHYFLLALFKGLPFIGMHQMPMTKFGRFLGSKVCGFFFVRMFCRSIIYFFVGGNQHTPYFIGEYSLKLVLRYFPSDISVKQVEHFYQLMRNDLFAPYDYGKHKNMELYGQQNVPSYNLSKVVAPTRLYLSEGDELILADNVRKLVDRLPNLSGVIEIQEKQFGHLDFLYSKEAKGTVYIDILKWFIDTLRQME